MALEPLPEKELMLTAGFSAPPSVLDQLDQLADYHGRNRSEIIRHLITSHWLLLQESLEKQNA